MTRLRAPVAGGRFLSGRIANAVVAESAGASVTA